MAVSELGNQTKESWRSCKGDAEHRGGGGEDSLPGTRWMLRKGPETTVIKGKTRALPRNMVAVLTDPS